MLLLLLFACALFAQETSQPSLPAGELVRATVANEVAAANQSGIKHFFRSRKQNPKGSNTKLYVETKDAMAGMLIATNDQPLSADQKQGELNHLNWLAGSPEALRKKQAREREDADRTLRIVKALPEAFLYEYAGTETGDHTRGHEGSQLARLKFTPNPSYSPPSRVEQVLQGMQGFVLIDTGSKRLAEIDGTLFRDVTFGWGIVGRLNKGGQFLVRQADVGDGAWDITEIKLNITARIFFFKNVSMVSDEVFSDFRRVPENLTFEQGMQLLKLEAARVDSTKQPD